MSLYTRNQKIPETKKKEIDTINSFFYTRYNTEENTNTNINSFNTTFNNFYYKKNLLSNYSNKNESSENYNEDSKNNDYNDNNQILSNSKYNDSRTNIDEIIKKQMSSAVIDSFLNQHQIKCIPMFILYLSEIWQELSKETNTSNNKNKGINLFSFNKFYNLPGLIGQRLFNILDIDKNGYLSPKEFINGMCTLFCEEINSLIKFIFNFYDFDEDEYITFDDIHAVLSYLPIINGFDDMIDIEEEIYSTIQDIFINKKEKINYINFSDLIIRKERYELFIPIITFFYDNKPFNNEEINEFYIGYYNEGKINANEGNYQITNVISLKESRTKEKKENDEIKSYKTIYKHGNIYKNQKKKNNCFEYYNIIDTANNNKTETNMNINDYKSQLINKNEGIKNFSKEEYEKYVLNSHGFEQMRKSIPLVINNSNILNANKKRELIKSSTSKNLKERQLRFEKKKPKNFKKKKREGSAIYNFCQNIIKGTSMTFNNNIDNDTDEFDNEKDSLQKSMAVKLDLNFNCLGDTSWKKNNNINYQRIKWESYLYKLTPKQKMKKLYFKLNIQDLFFYKNEQSKMHKGMHNLSTYFLKIDIPYTNNINNTNNKQISSTNDKYIQDYVYKKIINGIDYYIFSIVNIKGQIHNYYTPDFEIYEKWVNALKIILKYKNIYEQYIFKEIIGKGKNCIVFHAYDIKNKRDVAIKRINKSFLTFEDLSLIKTEIDTLKVCQHPYVVKLYEIIETYNEINIVLEHCELGNLYYYLNHMKFRLSEEEIAKYIHDISKAVYSMHNLGIIHRDLKLSNIALTKHNNKIEIRILDFGLSKILGPNQLCDEGYGTPGYAAPEVINRYKYSFEADVWSIGVIAYFLCSGKLPFDYVRKGRVEKDIIENTLLDDVKFDNTFIKKYSKFAVKFIKDLMNKNTFKRPNIREVLEHEWLQLYFKDEVKQRKINTYRNEFYENPEIEDIVTCDENIDKENNKNNRTNFLLYTSINNK